MDIRSTDTLPLPDIPVTVLLVSGQPADRSSLQQILVRSRWKLQVRATCSEGLALLRQVSFPVVICDAGQSDTDWRLLLNGISDLPLRPALIVSSRLADERLWAEVLNLGGYDVLSTPFDGREVLRTCFLAWQNWERSTLSATASYEDVDQAATRIPMTVDRTSENLRTPRRCSRAAGNVL
jgi:DNA-binding response OmpR family regulator